MLLRANFCSDYRQIQLICANTNRIQIRVCVFKLLECHVFLKFFRIILRVNLKLFYFAQNYPFRVFVSNVRNDPNGEHLRVEVFL